LVGAVRRWECRTALHPLGTWSCALCVDSGGPSHQGRGSHGVTGRTRQPQPVLSAGRVPRAESVRACSARRGSRASREREAPRWHRCPRSGCGSRPGAGNSRRSTPPCRSASVAGAAGRPSGAKLSRRNRSGRADARSWRNTAVRAASGALNRVTADRGVRRLAVERRIVAMLGVDALSCGSRHAVAGRDIRCGRVRDPFPSWRDRPRCLRSDPEGPH